MEGREEFEYFSDVRTFFDAYASSRVVEVGKNKSADEMFAEIKSMDLRIEIMRKAEKLAEDDYIKKYHRTPELNNTVDLAIGFYKEIVIAFEADDMAYYKFVYHVDTRKWEMYTFYRDGVKEWVENDA